MTDIVRLAKSVGTVKRHTVISSFASRHVHDCDVNLPDVLVNAYTPAMTASYRSTRSQGSDDGADGLEGLRELEAEFGEPGVACKLR